MANENEQEQWPPVWAYRLLAGIHFLRLLGLLTGVLLNIIMNAAYATGIDPVLIVGFSPLIILDLLFGFLLLMRKNKVILPITIYVSLIGIPFPLMALVSIFNPMLLLGYSFTVEMLLIAFLGLMWVNREWVRDSSDYHIPHTDKENFH